MATTRDKNGTAVRGGSKVGALKRLLPSLILAACSAYIFSLPWLGLGIGYIILTQAVQMPALFRTANEPVERQLHLSRLAIWLTVIVVIALVHTVRDDIHRKNADEIVKRLVAYSNRAGKCAVRTEDVGISSSELKNKLGGHAFYMCENGKPFLTYEASFMIYASWRYDFQRHVWIRDTSG